MKLLNFEKRADQSHAVMSGESLEELWSEAEQYGEVSLEPKTFSPGIYLAEVKFRRPVSGSFIIARGESREKADAMRKAIIEAVELGAVAKN